MDLTKPPGPLRILRPPLDLDAQELVVRAAAATGQPLTAAVALGYAPIQYTKTLEADPDFAAAIEAAIGVHVERLEAAADSRAVEGWDEPQFWKGEECGVIRRYSDGLLEMRLKALAPRRYRQNVAIEAKVAAGLLVVPASAADAPAWAAAFGSAAAESAAGAASTAAGSAADDTAAG